MVARRCPHPGVLDPPCGDLPQWAWERAFRQPRRRPPPTKVCPGWAVLGGVTAGKGRAGTHPISCFMDKFWHFAQRCEDLMAQGHVGAGSSLVSNARTECLTPLCRVRPTGWRRASHRGAGGRPLAGPRQGHCPWGSLGASSVFEGCGEQQVWWGPRGPAVCPWQRTLDLWHLPGRPSEGLDGGGT